MSKSTSEQNEDEDEDADADNTEQTRPEHLERLSDGCGCVEVWEGLSDYREQTD
ncbi:MAG: hypothetical protein J07HX64_00360 [halophilic archaeon J07HX64]|jgi:hypothetical protein|nr:MAG: hypothetical protein J07HX64_00360 [halophilic archaeon J07HX64]